MDYKEEYEAIVQRCRELHESGNALTKQQMEIVCPQLKEQPQGLDEAAEALADEHGFVKRPSCKPAKYSYQSVRDVFIEAAIAGAKWMAEQLESYKNLQSQEK